MYPSRQHQSRYLAALRRSNVARIAAVSAALVVPTSCAASDSEVFGAEQNPSATAEQATDEQPADEQPTDAVSTGTGGGAATSTSDVVTATPSTESPAAPTTASTAATETPAAAPVGAVFPADAEVEIGFTYAASSTGRVNNPYIAVWVEDTDGNLVRTVSVWFEQSQKGTRWLRDLRQWAALAADVEIDSTVTGATRAPGEYSLVWDGTDDAGNPVAQGQYVLLIESAREHGPYQTTSATITVSDEGFAVTMPDDGELVGASATMTV